MDGLQFHLRSVFLPRAKTLVVADLHVGRAAASDVTFPLGERRDLLSRLRELVADTDPTTVVFAGDVVHRFDAVTERARETVAALVDVCEAAGCEAVFVRGNHDTALDAVRDEVREAYVAAEEPRVVVCHGHEEPDIEADRYIIGHDHPAIAIEGQRRPCVLVAADAYHGADVVMLPAFSRVAAGVEVNQARGTDLQSPLLRRIDEARPVVYDESAEEPLTFPPLGELRRHL